MKQLRHGHTWALEGGSFVAVRCRHTGSEHSNPVVVTFLPLWRRGRMWSPPHHNKELKHTAVLWSKKKNHGSYLPAHTIRERFSVDRRI